MGINQSRKRHLKLRLRSTHDLELYLWQCLTVLPSSGDLVVLGQAAEEEPWALYLYRLKNGCLERRSVQQPCRHLLDKILGLNVQGQEVIVVACYDCWDIKLVDPKTGKATVAYKNSQHRPDHLCCKEQGRLWVFSNTAPPRVIELNCDKRPFTETGKAFKVQWLPLEFQYFPHPCNALVFSGLDGAVWAQSAETGEVLWKVSGKTIAGWKIKPQGMLAIPLLQVMLCADYFNNRILILDPVKGSILQTIQSPEEVGKPWNLCWKDQLIVQSDHQGEGRRKASFFALTINPQHFQPRMSGWNPRLKKSRRTSRSTGAPRILSALPEPETPPEPLTHSENEEPDPLHEDKESPTESSAEGKVKTEDLVAAYREALKDGSKPSYRARINIIGHSGAGKTCLTRRLLGQSFVEEHNSTDGIETHLIKLDLGSGELREEWTETIRDPQKLQRAFNTEVLLMHDALATMSNDEENASEETDPDIEYIYRRTPAGTVPSHREKPEETEIEVNEDVLEDLRRAKETAVETETPTGKLRLWDFGGQTEFYTTHHMFLDAEPLNIVVLDMSKGLKESLKEKAEGLAEGIPTTQEEFLWYWLKTIDAKARKQHTTATVFLVLTHKDLIPSSNLQEYTAEYTKKIMGAIEKLHVFNAIHVASIHSVDNKGGTETEFSHLRNELVKVIQHQTMKFNNTHQKIWGLETPLRWMRLEADLINQLDSDKTKNMEYIPREHVENIAAAYGIKDDELESCLSFYHTMGDFVYYREGNLNQVIILDPQWLVDMFKVLITPAEFANRRDMREDIATLLKNGTVTEKSLHKFWPGSDVNFLTELLMKFNLILPLIGTETEERRFLIPCMMPRKEVKVDKLEPFIRMTKAFEAESQTTFKELFPIGTFSKLIAEASQTWSICEDDHLSFHYASFEIEDGVRLVLTHPHGSRIQASMWFFPSHGHPLKIILDTRAKLQLKISICDIPQSEEFQLLCPHWTPEEEESRLVKVQEVTSVAKETRIQPTNLKFKCHQQLVTWRDFDPEDMSGQTPGLKMATKDLGLDTRIPEKDNADWPAGAVVDARDQRVKKRTLTDEDLLNLAQQLTNQMQISSVGLRLGLQQFTMDAAFTDHSSSIQEAAYQVLKTWRYSLTCPHQAYETLGSTLVTCELSRIAKEVLDFYHVPRPGS